MAYEKKDFIWTPTEADGFNYTSNLATMASSIETAVGKYVYYAEGTATPQDTSNFRPWTPGNVIMAIRIGRIVYLTGRWGANNASYISSYHQRVFAKLPAGFRPKDSPNFVCVGSGTSKWHLNVDNNGDLKAYGASESRTGAYVMTFNVTYLAED